MCRETQIQRLDQAAADLHKVAIDLRNFQDQQRAMNLLDSVADRLSVLQDETQFGDVLVSGNLYRASTLAVDAMVLMVNDDDLVTDVANVAASMATVARWHVQLAHRAAQRTRWGDGPGPLPKAAQRL